MLLYPVGDHLPLAELVRPKENHRSRKRPQKRRLPSSIQASPYPLLAQNGIIRRAERRVFGWYMRISLLSCLDRVERVHQHVSARAPEASRQHGVEVGRPALLEAGIPGAHIWRCCRLCGWERVFPGLDIRYPSLRTGRYMVGECKRYGRVWRSRRESVARAARGHLPV